ncbi:DUF2809 domain-containing protein [Christiangramia sabulilitoris]|uniref:DUF2809 domain-containing protein n=1 Tax=Christiangramia sabulilitoris TaxID=2583991 RepID=A0A550I3C8_9FLAO|nr:DUF2809 domain-containing protein [Christiangramia sabulilitoris]TRO65483.1 DUF2809 domain-containing protein [Christiangramia sabulilitoris]
MKIARNKRKYYLLGFAGLLIVEILIAAYVQDDFIRPYLGDFLVVILLYCLLMSISNISVIKALLMVLTFTFALEFFQMINIVKVFQYQPPEFVMIAIGSSFSTWDLLAYFLGICCTGLLEFYLNPGFIRIRN